MTQEQRAGVMWVVGVAVGLLMLGGFAYKVAYDVSNGGPERPASLTSRDEDAREAMNTLWSDMTTGERIDFCTEARASGYEVLVDEVTARTPYDAREVRYWLEDTCG